MAAGSIKGITIEIGGNTTKLGKALEDVNKKSRNLQRELKNVNTLLKYDPDNVELLNQKQQILNETIANTREKLETLKNAQQQVQEQFERGDITVEQYRSFQREIISTENKLESLSTQLKDSESSMDNLDNSANDLADSLDDIESSADSAGDGFNQLDGAMSVFTGNVLTEAASKIQDFAGDLMDINEETREFRKNLATLQGSSTEYGYSIEFTTEKAKELYKYIGDEDATTEAITNLQGLKLSEEEYTEALNGTIGAWTAHKDAISVEELTNAITETAQVGKVTGQMADALYLAGISEDEFNKKLETCGSTQERVSLITDTLNGAYGKSKTAYEEAAASLMEYNGAVYDSNLSQTDIAESLDAADTSIMNLKTSVLTALSPVITAIADSITALATAFLSLPQPIQNTILVVAGIAVALVGLIGSIGVISSAWGVLTGIFSAGIGIFTAVGGAIAAISTPVLIAVGAIASLIAIGITLYKNWDTIKAKASSIWNGIKSVISNVTSSISSTVTSKFNTIKSTATNSWNAIKNTTSTVWNGIKTIASNGLDWIKNKLLNFKPSWSIPKPKLPKISVSIAYKDILGANIPYPKFNVKWNAQGGILDGAQIFGMKGNTLLGGGEAGQEAVLPLDSFYEHLDRKLNQVNNQIDMKGLSDEISKALEGTGVYMDGKKVGTLLTDVIHNNINKNVERMARLSGTR